VRLEVTKAISYAELHRTQRNEREMELKRCLQTIAVLLSTTSLLQGVFGSGKKEDGGRFSRRGIMGVPGGTEDGKSPGHVEGGFSGGNRATSWRLAARSPMWAGGLLPDMGLDAGATDGQDGRTGKGSDTGTAARGASLDGSQGAGGGCPSYHMIGARGSLEGPSGSIAYSGIYQQVLAAIPGGVKQDLPYSSALEYVATVSQGAQTEQELIKRTLSKCPTTVFVLLGYSKGAMVQTQVLSSNEIPAERIAAVVLLGNPYFRAGAPQNRCGATSGMGVAAMMSGVTIPAELVDRVFDCCDAGDPVCDTPTWAGMDHLTYGTRHQAEAARFVIQRLREKIKP